MSKLWLLFTRKIKLSIMEEFLIKFFANKLKDNFKVFYAEDLIIGVSHDKGLFITNILGEIIDAPKIVLFRIDDPFIQYDREIVLLNHLQVMGAYISNPINSMICCKNKFLQLQLFLKSELPIAKTVYATNIEFENIIMHHDVDDKCVIKSPCGAYGNNVFLGLSKNMLKDISGCLDHTSPYLFQEYIQYSHGKSLRALVINNKISSINILESFDNNLKSNMAQGGNFSDVKNKFPQAEELALKATSCLGLDIAGVDLLFKEDGGFVVCEVGCNPPLHKSNINSNEIAHNILDMLEERLKLIENLTNYKTGCIK